MRICLAIPTFERAGCLDRLLGSLLASALPHGIEVRIFDNASTDKTREVVQGWMGRCLQLSWWPSPKNIGGVGNIRRALSESADCDYVWLLSDHMEFRGNVFPRLQEYLTVESPDLACIGLAEYARRSNLPARWSGRFDALTHKQQAELVFEFSNVSANLCRGRGISAALACSQTLGQLSYPHLCLVRAAVDAGAVLGRLVLPLGFQPGRVARYDWVESGFFRLGEAVAWHLGAAGGQGRLRTLTRIRAFARTAVVRMAERVAAGQPMGCPERERMWKHYGFCVLTGVIWAIGSCPPWLLRMILRRPLDPAAKPLEAFN